jgi:Na+/melibiose symporter-like transporter
MIIMARTIAAPVVDSLMIIQMKRDKERGAEDLETFGHICMGFGAIFFSIFGGYLITQHHHGTVFFNLTLLSGILIFISALIYPKVSEDNNDHLTTNSLEGLSEKLAMIKQFLKVTEIRNTLIYFFVVSIVCPNLEEFFVYFNESVHHLPAIFEGYTSIALGSVASILIFIYNTVLMKKFDLRQIVLTASAFRVMSSIVAVYQTKDYFLNTRLWLILQAIFFRSVVSAYLYMPGMVFFTKMVPH